MAKDVRDDSINPMTIARTSAVFEFGSVVESGTHDAWSQVLAFLQDHLKEAAWAYMTLQDKVILGRWNGTEFEWPQSLSPEPEFLMELIVFNGSTECKIIQVKPGDFRTRRVVDHNDKSGSQWSLDQQYLVYGEPTKNNVKSNWTVSRESSGGEIILPFDASGSRRVWCRVRDYFTIREPMIIRSGENTDNDESWTPSDGILFTDRSLRGFFLEAQDGNFSEVALT